MKDFQIREILKNTELLRFSNDGDSKIVQEMDISIAGARIDIAVINGAFHGYEIKSASDTLQRLPHQLIAYSYIFDYLTIITEEKYHKRIIDIIPEWVGVAICDNVNSEPQYFIRKESHLNQSQNKFHLAQLLWHDELVEVLSEQNIKFKKKSRNWILCETIANNIETEKLSEIVRGKLKKEKVGKLKKAV